MKNTRYFTADYIFPVASSPVKNGVIAADDQGVIIDILPSSSLSGTVKTEKFSGILCPGFINAHCHLELSYLKGKISEKKGLPGFINEIESIRNNFSLDEIQKAIAEAEDEMLKNGIVGVGDISNSELSFKQKSEKRLRYHTFIEALGFHPDKADAAFEKCLKLNQQLSISGLPSSITPHAPYSASEKLLKKINDFAAENASVLSIHNQESKEENRMFTEGNGKILECLKSLGIDISGWKPTGKNSLPSIFPHLPQENRILLVHNTFTSKSDIEFLKSRIPPPPAGRAAFVSHIYFCFCPNANHYIENRLPGFQMFIEENCKITIGTDSLASNWSLSVLDELKTISANAPAIPLHTMITWATKNGAEFFGWENELGTFEKGKKPGINWLKNIDLENLKLAGESGVERIC